MQVTVKAIVSSDTAQRSKFIPHREIGTFEVQVLIGTELHQFTMAVDLDRVGGRKIQIVNADAHFEETFKFNLKFNMDISQLVLQIYNHQPVELPVTLGEFEFQEMSGRVLR